MSRWWFHDALPFGEIRMWQPDYREFVCSVETAEWLLGGAMQTLDDVPVKLQIVNTLVGGNNVMVKVWVDTNALVTIEEQNQQVAA